MWVATRKQAKEWIYFITLLLIIHLALKMAEAKSLVKLQTAKKYKLIWLCPQTQCCQALQILSNSTPASPFQSIKES